MAELSPMMKQYFEIKKDYEDTILLFRLGDFYEMFYDDAKTASRELELVLTGRDCGQQERAPMCGVPFHSADSYIAKLVSRGYKVAVCEQMEDPSTAKGIVKRDVIRVITPGTVIESSMLDESKNNYLASVCIADGKVGMCFIDISTGEVNLTEFDENIEQRVINEMGRYLPSEILINPGMVSFKSLADFISKKLDASVELLTAEFELDNAEKVCKEHFGINDLTALSLNQRNCAVCALGAALSYLMSAQRHGLDNIKNVSFYTDAKFMNLGISAIRNLELLETMRDREKKGSLLWVLDKTKTAMGKRMLRSFIERPLYDCAEISKRLNAVDELYSNTPLREGEMEILTGVYDMERLMTRVVYNTANAKELLSLKSTLEKLPAIKDGLKDCKCGLLKSVYGETDTLDDVCSLIEASINEEAPFSVREGGMIKDGFNRELDELREIVNGGRTVIAKLEADEQERTGIKKLRIGYNKVFGYYFEVLNSYKELVPDHYIRKQTLTNCERYITEELKELETKVLGAQERIVGLEYEIFNSIRKKIAGEYLRTQHTAHALALLDVLCSFAAVSVRNNYTRPDINDKGVIRISEGRHPVIEELLKNTLFVPNDALLDRGENRTAIITGPNMAGKSTFMRQIAIIVLMAQMGCFVPARSADIGIVDSIFTRVGASDDLSSGQSTFMVEMNEVAEILKYATADSLIILDEIGRGTSTFDGMSIARAVVEYISDKKKIGAKTLFATHYHELSELEKTVDGVKNYNIAVKKHGDDITFLRRIVRGGADGSYGIEVAKLAGLPDNVIKRAKTILKTLEDNDLMKPKTETVVPEPEFEDIQISFSGNIRDEIIDKLKNIDINTLTPIEAMGILYELADKAKN
ncbi:MAG: DNA mismatch repair protein MutS [Oscillospiraceae bacterium]|nr:DNA mismatch repair protein MutS [Oscillospiraceae bacterium]